MTLLERTYRDLLALKKEKGGYKVKGILFPDVSMLSISEERKNYCEVDNFDECIIVFLCINTECRHCGKSFVDNYLKELGMALLIANECDELLNVFEYKTSSALYKAFINILYTCKKIKNRGYYKDDMLAKAKSGDYIDMDVSAGDCIDDTSMVNIIDIIKTGSKPNLFIAENEKDSLFILNETIRNAIFYMLNEEDHVTGINEDHLIAVPSFYDQNGLRFAKSENSSEELYKIGMSIYSLSNKDAVIFGIHWNKDKYTTVLKYITAIFGVPKIIIKVEESDYET